MIMYLYTTICDFLIATWLWHMTFDWFHPFITGITMFALMRLVMRSSRSISLIVSSSAQLFAMTIFFVLVIGGLVHGLHWNFEPQYIPHAPEEFYASLSVALVYIVLQALYFWIGSLWYGYTFLPYFFVIFISNSIGMIVSYVLARMAMAWSYVG